MLGTAWDYQDYPDEFIAKLAAIEERGVTVCNPPAVVRWNADKRYLDELAQQGAAIVPTLWRRDLGRAGVQDAMAHFAADRVVVKRQVGAGGIGQHSFARDSLPDDSWTMGCPCMVQPFLPSVVEEGEFTYVFIDGAFSHGVCKRAGPDDYRIQSLYGGYETPYTPDARDLAAAQAVVAALPFEPLLYARIDMVRLPSGTRSRVDRTLSLPRAGGQSGRIGSARRARKVAERKLGPSPIVPGALVLQRDALPAPFAPVFGGLEHFISKLQLLELGCGFLVARLDVGMHRLGLVAPGLLDRREIGVGVQFEHFQRAHFVGAARAVAAAAPAVMLRLGIAGILAAFGRRAGFLLGLVEPFEIVPLAIVFGRVLLAEHPPLGAVRRLGRGAFAGLFAAVPVAQAHGRRLARGTVATPAGEAPVVRTARLSHGAKKSIVGKTSRLI